MLQSPLWPFHNDKQLRFVSAVCGLQIVAAMHAYVQRPRPAWVREWPAMVVLAVSQIFWARGVEEAVTADNLQASSSSRWSVLGWQQYLPHMQVMLGRVRTSLS